jgi:phosphoribosylformylglycinamidine synthase
MKARIIISLKDSVLDPQGQAIANALKHLKFHNIQSVRQGKIFEITFKEKDSKKAYQQLDNMCKRLLVNLVIEDYHIALLP